MDREILSIKDLTIEELTAQALQLLNISLADLYTVLGFQLAGYSRPARLATLIQYHSSLEKFLESPATYAGAGGASPVQDVSRGLKSVYEELCQEGMAFVENVREELSKVLSSSESLELAHRATVASMQILVLMIAGALRMPPQTESLAATIAAIVCKSGLKEFCQMRTSKN
jgi:hypothetical protein